MVEIYDSGIAERFFSRLKKIACLEEKLKNPNQTEKKRLNRELDLRRERRRLGLERERVNYVN